jgi:hypothetical protein
LFIVLLLINNNSLDAGFRPIARSVIDCRCISFKTQISFSPGFSREPKILEKNAFLVGTSVKDILYHQLQSKNINYLFDEIPFFFHLGTS